MLKLLFNPLADGGNGEAASIEAEAKLIEAGKVVERIDSTKIDVNKLVMELTKEDEVAILGGDGTLNYFINHVTNFPNNKIYLYPSGTGNDFLNDIKAYEKPVAGGLYELNKFLLNLPKIDVKGKTYRFINGIGFGIDGECCVEADKKKAAGETEIDYSKITIGLLLGPFKPRTATLRIDGGEPIVIKKAYLCSAMHGRMYGGGMDIAPDQRRNCGHLTAAVIHGKSKLGILMNFPGLFKGKHKGKKWALLKSGRTIEVSFDVPCGLQIDGEVVEDVTSYKAYLD
ncbi:MAG: diacylglycerol kinase family protein [Bacilli bacterium]|nr:diacylglycerol kinase family protein [Bacilli bacterium]